MIPISDYADVMTIEDFKSYVDCGAFIEYDGCGFYCNLTHESDVSVWNNQPAPEWATHVAWYNR